MSFRNRRIATLVDSDRVRGDTSEAVVEKVLRMMAGFDDIHHYHKARSGQELDMQGIDFLVFPESSWCIPLQVKSSERGKEKHQVELNSKIPCIVVNRPDTTYIYEKLLEVLGLSTEGLYPEEPEDVLPLQLTLPI